MHKTFEHYHLSLIERPQIDWVAGSLDREQWLRRAFGEQFTFRHQGKEFHWVPHGDVEPMIVGTVERKRTRLQHRAPDEGASEFLADEWQGSLVVIDPIYRPDGQKVAFEVDSSVGKTNAILDSIVSHLNDPRAQYTLFVKPLFDSEGFWRFAERHGGLVEAVTFNFLVPNMFFGAKTGVDTGLRRIGTDTGAQEVKITLDSESGVDANSQSVRDAMAYAEAGNATVTAKALNGDRYSSTRRRRSSKVLGFLTDGKEAVQQWLERALGRGEENSVGDDAPAAAGPDGD